MTDLEEMFATRFSREEMIKSVDGSAENFEKTMEIAMSDRQPQAWRAAWIIGHCTKKADARLISHAGTLITTIKNKQDGYQRELIKLISKIDLNEEQEGIMFDTCMTIWETIKKSPSVRIFAFRYIASVVKKYPELKEEISFITQGHYLESLSPGIRKGVEKTIREVLD